ncbi:acyl-CoA dehydrogenase family protein [Marinobacter zhejiangensis]|uniref:Acyl-CoA dehydrogenase n=1 Tax=Marinobacter zhejiangensis TaxID=488535 RepID=A0A1I4NMD3_9GAMM|nr:acyl-CoA dehydrogenase family protein [Marinobacter zhejiangensis]SFM16649.1 Acyl-CoA dehydrogenase [Marinobacter zhejiangensis]
MSRQPRQNRDPIGLALSSMTRLASSPWLDRLGMRTPVEKAAYQGTKAGFRTLSLAAREVSRVSSWLPRNKLPNRQSQDLFDLSLDEDQTIIVDTLQRLAADVLRPAAAEADEAAAMPARVFEAANELGLALYAIPEPFGGVAEYQSPVNSVLIAEQLAYGDMGLALALLAPFGVAQAITQWGTGAQQSSFLPLFCEADAPIATIAVDEPTPLFDPRQLQTHARRSNDGFELTGSKSGVVLGEVSDLILVAAELEGLPRLFLVPGGVDGLHRTADPGMGLRAAQLARLDFDRVALPKEALLGDDTFDYDNFLDRASLMRCGLAIGTAQAVLDYVISYCNERTAFGEPISHRQSVAFMISNMAIETDSMRLLTWRAASRAESGMSWHREASLARLLCNEKAMETGTQGVQLLGGHGFVKEHPVERWYRDLRSVAVHFGGAHA